MNTATLVSMWIGELVPISATLFAFIYGIKHFFKKGKPLYLQSITMAMGCHSLSSIYHLCQTLTNESVFEGFTPAYLGRIGFFLFLIAASYGQLDRIVDDRSPAMRPSKYISLLGPLLVALLYIPNAVIDVPTSTKIAFAIVWLPAMTSVYFNLKHAIIPDLDFGFIKAIKPYNYIAVLLAFAELLYLTSWNYLNGAMLIISSVIFGAASICTVIAAKKGAEKWTV